MRANPIDDFVSWLESLQTWTESTIASARELAGPVLGRMAPGSALDPIVIIVLLLVGAAPVLAGPTWKVLRHAVTIVHEMGHVMIATAMGRRIEGIKLHTDTSGVALTSGKPRGFGMLVTVLAGYTAPSFWGALIVWCVASGWSGAALTVSCLVLALALVLVRNAWGLITVSATLLLSGLIWWYQAGDVSAALTTVFAGALLAGGIRCTFDLADAHSRGEGAVSDAGQAGSLSHTPSAMWVGFFQLYSFAAAGLAAYLLLRGAL